MEATHFCLYIYFLEKDMAKLFIAESSKKSIENLEHFLRADGHDPFFWDHAEPLEKIMTENKFDLSIIDLNYKEMPSSEIINLILKNPDFSNSQIIVTTSSPNKDALTKYSSLGVNFIFVKPYRYKLLSDKIKYIMNPIRGDHGAFEPDILKIFLESTIHIFESVSGISVEASKPFLKSGNKSLSEVSAVIGLSSPQVKGSLSINVTRDILTRCLLKILGADMDASHVDDAALSDMCGELCNQVMGRAKQQFLKKKSMSFEISVPTVLSDANHILDYKSSSPVLVIPFKIEKIEAIFVEFCLELNDTYEPVAPDKLQVVVEEGELVLF